MKPTLRSLGIEYISQFVSDKPTFIAGALKEYEELLMDPETPLQTPLIAHQSLEDRVDGVLGRKGRVGSLISWFLQESGLEFTKEQALRDRVLFEQEYARTIQFWGDEVIFAAYHEIVSKNPGKLLSMSDILECLNSRKD